jgi:hypothetical protein
MSDFESRLTDALSSGAEGAPDASGLADRARRRSRRRRRAAVIVAAGAVVVAVAVPVGVVALRDDGPGGGGPAESGVADDPVGQEQTPAPPDTRIETWHDLQVAVPASWGYGARTTWCAGGKAETPVVERPGGATLAIACTPANGFGLTFGSSAAVSPAYESGEVWQYEAGDEEYVPGSWLGYWYDDTRLVQVNAADKATVQAVLDSVQVVDSVDGNGCPVTRQEGFTTDSDQMSVCRYDAAGDLEQSELLSTDDTASAIAALHDAPAADPGKQGDACAGPQTERVVVDLITTDVSSEAILQAPCPYQPGITSGGESFQELTPDVLYWALSPGWSGGLGNGVRLPEKLRELSVSETEGSSEPFCKDRGGGNGNGYVINMPTEDQLPLVCRYELEWGAESGGSYVLDSERKLSEDELEELVTALGSAPTIDVPLSTDCARGRGELFTIYWNNASAEVYNGECGEQSTRTAEGAVPAFKETSSELLDALGSPYGLLR